MIDRTYSTRMPTQVSHALEVALTPNPVSKGDGDYEIGYEAAKRDVLAMLRSVLGPDYLEFKI